MKIVALLMAAFFSFSNAQASSWETVTGNVESKDVFIYWEIDLDSVQWRDGLRQAWVRYTTSPAQKIQYTDISYQTALSLTHYDCSLKDEVMSQTNFYTGRFGNGDVVHSISMKKNLIKDNMKTVAPGTFGETLLNFVCAAKLKKQ